MATTTINLPLIVGKLIDSQHPNTRGDWASNSYIDLNSFTDLHVSRGYAQFNGLDDSYKYSRLYSAQIYFPNASNSGNQHIALYGYEDSINLSTITWNNAPALPSQAIGVTQGLNTAMYIPTATQEFAAMTTSQLSEAAKQALSAGTLAIAILEENQNSRLYTKYNNTQPYIRVVLDPAITIISKVVVENSPTSGYVNPRVVNTFHWKFVSTDSTYTCLSDFGQSSATFYWRVTGASSWNSISASSTTLTVPANTFTTGRTIEWYVDATDGAGTRSTTPTYTISTTAAAMVATPISPANSIEANDSGITFRWSASSADGFPQNGAQVQYSTDGSSWQTLGSTSGATVTYTAPANTLPTGTIYWRVRGRNIDSSYGAWSSPVSFVSFGAPAAPSVTASPGNFTEIQWQTSEQSAYRVTVAGKTYGAFFGEEKDFQIKDPLPAGDYTASVEVQNSFGLWSQPGTVNFTVVQQGHMRPQITASRFDVDATISYFIYNVSSTNELLVYRDGVKIASLPVTATGTFTDRHALGTHTYQVIVRVNDYYAAYSAEVTGTMKSCTPRIGLLAGGGWLDLRLSDQPQRAQVFSKSRLTSLRHFSGATFPVAEVGTWEDETGTYDAAFLTPQEFAALEAFYGKAVIMKTPGGQVLVGILSNLEKTFGEYYIAARFTISRMHWGDFLDLSGS